MLDLSQPVATVLREGSKEAHERAEHSQGGHWLALGQLDKEEYVRFMMMLYHVYDAFERALNQHATNPVLAPTHNPGLFARSESIAADISCLLDVPETEWRAHPTYVALQANPPAALTQYTGRIEELAAGPDPSLLLAHAYVRYLGDLSGGQYIRRNTAKAYGLEGPVGLSFYDFRSLNGVVADAANAGEMKRIKEWYREGMNAGVGDNNELKASILEEAIRAFDLNTGLFDTLKPPTKVSSSPLVVEDVGHSPHLADIKASGEAKTVFEAENTEGWDYRATSVMAVIAAFSIAHFVLVVCGFTGSKGYAKLEAFQQWFDDLFGASHT